MRAPPFICTCVNWRLLALARALSRLAAARSPPGPQCVFLSDRYRCIVLHTGVGHVYTDVQVSVCCMHMYTPAQLCMVLVRPHQSTMCRAQHLAPAWLTNVLLHPLSTSRVRTCSNPGGRCVVWLLRRSNVDVELYSHACVAP